MLSPYQWKGSLLQEVYVYDIHVPLVLLVVLVALEAKPMDKNECET